MQLMDPMEAALMSAETLVNPIHVAALMIFSPPDDAGPGFVDDLYTQGLIATDAVDPRLAASSSRHRPIPADERTWALPSFRVDDGLCDIRCGT